MNRLNVTMTKPEKYILAGYLLFELFLLPWLLRLLSDTFSLNWTPAALNFLYFLLNFLAVITICGRFLTLSVVHGTKNPGRVFITYFVWLGGYWLCTTLVSALIVWAYPDFSNINDASISQLVDTNPTLMIIGTVFLVPLVEECLYRGLVFGFLHRHSRVAAYVASTLLFSMIHIMGYIGVYSAPLLLLCALQYVPAGLCLARAYEKADNIFAPILIHTTINAIGMIAMR